MSSSSIEVNQHIYRNPLLHESVQDAALNTLMDELKVLQEKTLEWKKPKAGDSCSHMHVECWNGIFMCSGCYKEISDPERVQSEKELMNKIGASDPSEPTDSVNRGISIAFLVILCQTFDLYEVTTGEVLRNFIVPLTSGSRCRFVELEEMKKSGVVGQATTFISHCNKAEFGVLVAALCDGGADLTRRVWVDIFTVRQWPSSKSDLHFEVVIEQCPSFMVICPFLEEVRKMNWEDVISRRFPAAAKAQVAYFRIWCLYEIFYAAKFNKPIGMKCGGRQKSILSFESDDIMLGKMYFAIDVVQAEATVPSDRNMIFDKILSYEEGIAGFNGRVRGVIIGARMACHHPVLVCASCGDAAAMAVVREQSEEYFAVAAAGGFLAVLKDLLLWDGNIIYSHKSQEGYNSLHHAALGGHLACLQWLVKNGAGIHVAGHDGMTALLCATQGGQLTCLQWLVGNGSDITVVDKEGMTAVHLAAKGGHLTCLQWLGENGADINVASKVGLTALMLAALGGHLTCLKWLVEKGVDINVANTEGYTAHLWTVINNHEACGDYLISKGATSARLW